MVVVTCSFAIPLGRNDLHDYIRQLDLAVEVFDDNGKQLVLGKVSGDQLMLFQAELDGIDLFSICDNDSQGMYELYEAVFDCHEFQDELEVEDVVDHILFFWDATFHPKLRPYQKSILEVLCTLFGESCVVVMWRDVVELDDRELSKMGFAKIANTEFVFRRVPLQTDYGRANPRGIEIREELVATTEDEASVLADWKKRNATE